MTRGGGGDGERKGEGRRRERAHRNRTDVHWFVFHFKPIINGEWTTILSAKNHLSVLVNLFRNIIGVRFLFEIRGMSYSICIVLSYNAVVRTLTVLYKSCLPDFTSHNYLLYILWTNSMMVMIMMTVANPGFLERGRERRVAESHEGVGCRGGPVGFGEWCLRRGCAPPQKKNLKFCFWNCTF